MNDFAAVNVPLAEAAQNPSVRARVREAAAAVRNHMDDLGAVRMPSIGHPLVIDRSAHDRLAEAARAVIDAQTQLLAGWRSETSSELLARFGLPQHLADLIDRSQLLSQNRMIARFDVLPTSDGYRFCELNVDPTVSGFEVFDCARVFSHRLGLDWVDPDQSPARRIASLIVEAFHAGGHERVVICDWSSRIGVGYFGFEVLRDAVAEQLRGVDVSLVYHRDFDESSLDPERAARTLIYRGFMLADVDDPGFVRRVFGSGAEIISRFETEIRSHKLWFALLHEAAEKGQLDPRAAHAVRAYLPRTLRLDDDVLSRLLPDRADWVFKHGASTGGQAVLMGAEHTASSLRSRIVGRGTSGWVAQERVETTGVFCPATGDSEPEQMEVVLGLYVVAGRPVPGLNVRAHPTTAVVSVRNSASSGWAVPMTAQQRARAVSDLASVRPLST